MSIIFIGIFSIVVPSLTNNIYHAVKHLPNYFTSGEQTPFSKWLNDFSPKLLSGYKANIIQHLSQSINLVLSFFMQLISMNVNLIVFLLIVPFVMFFGLRDWEKMSKALYKWVPLSKQHSLKQLLGLIHTAIMRYIRGQLLISLIMVIYYTCALLLYGFNGSITLGIFSGVLSFLPYAGCVGGFIISSVICLTQYGWSFPFWPLAIIYFIGYVIEIYILTPKISKKLGLHTIWVFLALFLGAQISGLFGIFISIPSALVINVTIRYLLVKFRQTKIYQNG